MADTVQMTSKDGVSVTVAEATEHTLSRMGYVRADEATEPAEKPKPTRRRAPRKTAEPSTESAPVKGSGPFG